jgi:hypothetical protein
VSNCAKLECLSGGIIFSYDWRTSLGKINLQTQNYGIVKIFSNIIKTEGQSFLNFSSVFKIVMPKKK